MTTAPCNSDDPVCTYLSLGDGDFSYSVDLARYLSSSLSSRGALQHRTAHFRVVATGVDSLNELKEKYRDSPSLLKELKSQQTENLSVEIRHGVNAITAATNPAPSDVTADHVIFNHPHLGREDAEKHQRFLAHLLHSASSHWMRHNGGVFHLTLVNGQYERWDCGASAEKHGLVLLERNSFRPPPLECPRYRHRRHHTGKSFASRVTGGSETFTFGRKRDHGRYVATCLPWQHEVHRPQQVSSEHSFACNQCERVFREERSLRNHVRSAHGPDDKKRKRKQPLVCIACKKQGVERTFPHEQSLADHMRAKHTGEHFYILPDWADAKKQKAGDIIAAETIVGDADKSRIEDLPYCLICGIRYSTEDDEAAHLDEFIPSSITKPSLPLDDCGANTFHCSYCSKGFANQRAQHQHENFCSLRSKQQHSSN